MEILLKRYSWTLNIAVVILAGLVAGRAVSALSEVHLSEPIKISRAETERPRTIHSVSTTVNSKGLADIFGLKLPTDEPEKEEEPEEEYLGDEIPTTLNATLVATIEANPAKYSISLITDNNARETGVYAVGDTLMEVAEILRIERRRVLIRNAGRTEYLEMDEDDSPPATASTESRPVAAAARRERITSPRRPPAVSRPSMGPDISDSITKTGEHEYTIAKDALESTLSNLNTIATQARIVPSFKDGVSEGFKLFSIRPGSLYSQIGIQNGDVVRKINGFEINSPDRALEVYSRLRDSNRIEVEVERRGQTIRQVYNVK